MRQAGPAVLDEGRLVELLAGSQHHNGLDGLAPLVVGYPDDRRVDHRRVGEEHVLHLCGIDVLAAAHHHVLDPVVEVQVALVVAVAGVTGAQPALVVDRRVGVEGLRPITRHVVRGPGPDLPDGARLDVRAGVRVHDPQLDGPVRLAGRPQQAAAGTVGVVVLELQGRDGARGLGHPVHLAETAAEGRQAPDEDVLRDGRRTIEDQPEARQVGRGQRRRGQQQHEDGGDDEHLGDPLGGDEPEQQCRIDVTRNDRPAATRHRTEGPPRPPDVEEGHGDQADRVGADVERLPGFRDGGRQIGVGQRDAFRQARGPRRVEQHAHLIGRPDMARVAVRAALDPGVEADATRIGRAFRPITDDDDAADGGEVARHLGECREVIGVDSQHRRTGVVDDGRHFCRGQPPVDRHVHCADQRAAEEEVEVGHAVAVQESDAVTRPQAVPSRGAGDPAGSRVLLAPTPPCPALHEHLGLGPLATEVPDQARHRVAVVVAGGDARWHR